MDLPMTELQVKQALRLQKAAQKTTKLTYRGLQYLMTK